MNELPFVVRVRYDDQRFGKYAFQPIFNQGGIGMWSVRFCLFAMATGALFAQHEFTQTDVEVGARLYINNCIYCHGPDGDQIAGVNLTHGKFKTAVTDADLMRIIQKGIPEAGMPAQTMPDANIKTIIAYLRSSASNASELPAGGDAARGKAVFGAKGCSNCHRVREVGGTTGPDLTDIGSQRRVLDFEKKLDDPNADILPQNRVFRAVTKDGNTVTGRILNQDTFTVQLADGKGRLLSLSRADLREFAAADKSPMPSFKSRLTAQERTDLLTYLVSLKGH